MASAAEEITAFERARWVMGTLLVARVDAVNRKAANDFLEHILAGIQTLEQKWSRFRTESEISTGRYSSETQTALVLAERFSIETRGYFAPHSKGWDLGAIGKGLAADWAVQQAQTTPNIQALRLDFGGQLTFWRRDIFIPKTVHIEIPAWRLTERPVLRLIRNGTLSCTAQSEREGHLMDPKTQKPAAHWRQIIVFSESAAAADAWSTALFAAENDFLPKPATPVQAWAIPFNKDSVLEYPWI